jgi:hypothetical protein
MAKAEVVKAIQNCFADAIKNGAKLAAKGSNPSPERSDHKMLSLPTASVKMALVREAFATVNSSTNFLESTLQLVHQIMRRMSLPSIFSMC